MNERILVVDDTEAILDAVTDALAAEGFEVQGASDGRAALEAAEAEPFDLVILDLMLPGLSGTEICRRLRAESPVPIIMLTARDAEADRVLGLEIGADDYITKPFSEVELLSRVRAILRRRELDRLGDVTVRRLGGLSHRRRQARGGRRRQAGGAHAIGVQPARPARRGAGASLHAPRDHAASLAEQLRRRRASVRRARFNTTRKNRA